MAIPQAVLRLLVNRRPRRPLGGRQAVCARRLVVEREAGDPEGYGGVAEHVDRWTITNATMIASAGVAIQATTPHHAGGRAGQRPRWLASPSRVPVPSAPTRAHSNQKHNGALLRALDVRLGIRGLRRR